MTKPASASPANTPAESPATAALRAKQNFVTTAHAASPMRAVERYPWTAVTATAAATMAATVVVSLPVFGKSTGKVGGTLLASAMAIAGSLLQAKFVPPGVNVEASVKPMPKAADSAANVKAGGPG